MSEIQKLELMPEPVGLKPGQAYWTNYDGIRCLFLTCYKCGAGGFTSLHKNTENPDGTITLDPSVMCPADCGAHYYIRDSKIIQ